jgi:hypothetical protein
LAALHPFRLRLTSRPMQALFPGVRE